MKQHLTYFLFAASIAVLLNACSSTPTNNANKAKQSSSQKSTKMVPALKGGGYYKDDGPGDYIPADLDSVPNAIPKLEPLHKPALKPYNVLGKSYTPNTKLQPYKQKGIASWYGKKFHGQKTSIGEPYDMFAMTAAHTTLALPSYVRVTRVANGKSVILRVTDRGPFHTGRIIDLSYTAAHKLGIIKGGSAEVIVEAILPGDPDFGVETPTTTVATTTPISSVIAEVAGINSKIINTKTAIKNSSLDNFNNSNNNNTIAELKNSVADVIPEDLSKNVHGYYIQLGAFSNLENAENLKIHISRQLDWLTETPKIYPSDNLHRLQIGPYKNKTTANKIAERIYTETGYKPALVHR